jgi:hypothetical protein
MYEVLAPNTRKEQLPIHHRTLLACSLIMAMTSWGMNASAQEGTGATPSPKGAVVYIISPAQGETVTSPVTVRFGLEGMGVAPAGVDKPKTGHHHLIVDSGLPDSRQPIPADDNHIHFGGGQTETSLKLAPGTHTLQLLLADYRHVPHLPVVVSQKITITVE